MSLRRCAACVLAFTVIASAGEARAASHVDEDAELRLFGLVNRARLAAGLMPLERDERLAVLARYHSADMALSGFVNTLSPTEGPVAARAAARLGLTDLRRVVAHVAAGAAALADARPLLDASLTRVGIGVVGDGDHVFVTWLAVADAPAADALSLWRAAGGMPGRRSLTLVGEMLRRRLQPLSLWW